MPKPLIQQVLGVFIVVADLEKAMRGYEDLYGIGPWDVQDFGDAAVPGKRVAGQSVQYQMKLATCAALNVQLALVEPLDELSAFSKHLRTKGPGVHHLLVLPQDGFDETIRSVAQNGGRELQGGKTGNGIEYAHLDLANDLGLVIEIFKLPG